MNKKYSPILTDTTKEIFFRYLEHVDLPEIDYFAIGIQSSLTKSSISLMSRPEWQKHFNYNQYAEFDPLRKATLNTTRNFIPFTEIDYSDNFGKEIMHQRGLFGIQDGIILMERLKHHNYIVTLGTNFSRFNAFDFLNTHYDGLKNLKCDLIKIIEKDAIQFLSKQISKNYD